MSAITTAHELYIKHHGTNHRLIESEMHSLGFKTFSRRRLYNHRTSSGKLRLGWIEKYKWKAELSEPSAVTGGSPASNNISVLSCSSVVDDFSSQRLCASVVNDPQDQDFEAWLSKISPTMRWDWSYQKLIYEKLQAMTEGRSKRLMIFLPPRHGKSELVTVRYTAWRLQNDPALSVILGSYNQRLANRFSRKVRITWEDSIAMQNAKGSIENESVHDASLTFAGKIFSNAKSEIPNPQSDGSTVAENGSQRLSVPAVQSSRRRLNTVAEWETGLGGGLRAVGVGGGITGFGAGLVIIDDPVKSRAEAESKAYREKLWEWYRDDLYTRLEPNASIILIQTRWHEDDLAGRLLKEMHDGGEHWDVISLPALAEVHSPAGCSTSGNNSNSLDSIRVDECSSVADSSAPGLRASEVQVDPLGRTEGDPLCPDRFSKEDLLRIKRNLGSYSFSALYQQRPTPPEGGLFKRQWFSRIVDRAPQNIRWCRGYDLALSTKDSADYTASFRCAIDRATGDLYIADGFRKRIEFPDQRRYILKRILEERQTEHGIEHALHGLAFIQEFRREHRLVSRSFRSVKVSADKFNRALCWANRAEEGKVVLVRGPWIEEFLEEVTSFPSGAHDDQIDAVSIAVQMLEHHRHAAMSF